MISPDLVDVHVISPSQKPVKLKKEAVPEGTEVTFVPEENGPHTVGCWVQDQPVDETPCIVKSVPKNEIPSMIQSQPSSGKLHLPDKGISIIY